MTTPAPAPTTVGQEVPATGRVGSSVGSGVGVLVAFGLGVGVLVGVKVGGGAVGAGVGDGVGDGVGVGVAVAVLVAAAKVNERAVQDDGTAAAGFEVGAVGATGCCLN